MKFCLYSTCEIKLKDLLITTFSASFYGYLKENGAKYSYNDRIITAQSIIGANSYIIIEYIPKKQDGFIENENLDILYEDENIIIIDKPYGLLSIPSKANPYDSVYNRLLGYYLNKDITVHLLNRLDKDAAGLIIIAKNQHTAALMDRDKVKIEKKYLVKTTKKLPENNGIITLPIAKVGPNCWNVSENGKFSKTIYRYLETIDNIMYYEVILQTGRTHQIRIHFKASGAPLLGDLIYGGSPKDHLGLICKKISFINPWTKEVHNIESKYE